MKVTEIKAILKPLGILQGINLYPDEPTSGFHYVSVAKGGKTRAIEALKAAGADAMPVPACSNVYGDNLQVRR